MKYKINKGFIVQKIGNKSTIFDGEKSALYTFNKTGTIIFEKIKLGWNEKRIVEFIAEVYDVSLNNAKKDFNEFVKELIESKIIKKI